MTILSLREFTKENFESARSRLGRRCGQERDVNVTADLLTVWWMGPGGIAGTKTKPWFAQRHTNTGGCPKKRWSSFKESLPSIAQKLSRATALCMDFRPFLARIKDEQETAIYADPPYFEKSFEYEEDFTEYDHEQLALILNQYQHCRVVVSYRYDERLEEYYPRDKWKWVEVEMAKAMSHAGGKPTRNTEILLLNN